MTKWHNKDIISIDKKTGEVLEGVSVYVAPTIRWREDWFMGIQETFIALAEDREIAGAPRRVLDFLFGKLAFENFICIEQKEIAERLGLKKQHVSSYLKLLLHKGIILPGPRIGNTASYRLNSRYGWRGTIVNLAKRREEERETLRIVSKDGELV